MAIGAGIGAIVGGGGSAVSQIYSGGKINWKDVGIDILYNMFERRKLNEIFEKNNGCRNK